jgi:preprotein translocase subunit SecE
MSDKTKSPSGAKVPMPNMRRGVRSYFRDVRDEMRKVVWPTPTETIRLATTVIAVCIIFVLYLFAFGAIVEKVVNMLLGKG